jgi:acetylornithine/succinyldiaminopimelate/putrescine aminotransferase
VNALHELGLLTVPAGTQIVRLLPALNLTSTEAGQGMQTIETLVSRLAGQAAK